MVEGRITMVLERRGEHWYGDTIADIYALLDHNARPGEPIVAVREVVCECGCTVFSVQADDEYREAAWSCRRCDAQYLFHARRIDGYYEGDPETDSQCLNCSCSERGESEFELAVGVTLYSGSEDVDWAYIGCRRVACGLTGYLAQWHRIAYPYEELFAHMDNKQDA
jgi:hypothetical protein